ncbi:MAG: hypothetical protein WBA93_27090 [Microcoleaceae cyanobacterium]
MSEAIPNPTCFINMAELRSPDIKVSQLEQIFHLLLNVLGTLFKQIAQY